jgi:hypothetical protein
MIAEESPAEQAMCKIKQDQVIYYHISCIPSSKR